MNDQRDGARRGREDTHMERPADGNDGVLEHQIDEERIARRAYEIYESRGRADGHADEDWSQAALEYAARHSVPRAVGDYGAGSSFGDRVRNARR